MNLTTQGLTPACMGEEKLFFVPWQCSDESLDCLALQGPHTRAAAEKLANELRERGYMASVIDCSASLKARHN